MPNLDRTSLDDLEFVNALTLNAPVRMVVSGRVSTKAFTVRTGADDEKTVGYYATIAIGDIEIGEPA